MALTILVNYSKESPELSSKIINPKFLNIIISLVYPNISVYYKSSSIVSIIAKLLNNIVQTFTSNEQETMICLYTQETKASEFWENEITKIIVSKDNFENSVLGYSTLYEGYKENVTF